MTSQRTSLSSPPRIGSGQTKTGCSTQSDRSPVACWVLDPSKPQIGGSSPFGTILVLERSFLVGSVPSIQMYSARYTLIDSPSRLLAVICVADAVLSQP